MTNTKPAFIIALAIILSSTILSIESIKSIIDDQNVLQLENGTARLGKIYEERLITSIHIKDAETGEELLSAEAPTGSIYASAKNELQKTIDGINKSGGITDDNGKLEKLSIEQVTLKKNMTVTIKTYIKYRSEYQPSFSLTIDENEKSAGIGTQIHNVLLNTKDYSSKMLETFYADRLMK